tara:strand:+ start:236 stop:637 length:402 start_codon:yes stop_codon:yes gene_type:complete
MAKKAGVEFLGTGRRKTAVARVRLTEGTGKLTVNGRAFADYHLTEQLQKLASAPLAEVDKKDSVDAVIKVVGGGPIGQAGAVSHGLARALEKMDSELRIPLKKAGHLRRDPRKKERKKTGQPGARKRFQFSKR